MDALNDTIKFSDAVTRRIGADEVKARLRCSETWLRRLIQTGVFPAPRFDPGGRRRWWMNDEVAFAIRRMNEKGTQGRTSKMPPITGAEPRRRHKAALAARGSSAGNHTPHEKSTARPPRSTTPTKHDAGVRRSTKAPDGAQRT